MTISRFFKRLTATVLTVACFALCFSAVNLKTPVVSAAYENTHVNTGNQPFDLVAVAKTQLGYKEGANNYNKYSAEFSSPYLPWCGFFVSWCARQAGIPPTVIPTSGGATSFFNIGTYHARNSGYIPQAGDIMLYGSYGDSYHVSIVEYFDTTTNKVHVIDGNWSDQVSAHSTPLTNTEVAGFVTPYYTSSLKELTAYSMKTPVMIVAGKSFSISGYIGSPNLISKVTVSITDKNGKTVTSASGAPNAKGFNINALDSKIAFGKLAEGSYTFTVTATDSKQTKRWDYPFSVVNTIQMLIDNVTVPETLAVGSTFKIGGTITCPEPLTVVSVSVYDKNGTYKTGGTAAPNAQSYDISGIDQYVSFGKLAAGSYTLTVVAKSAGGSTKWEYPFTVTPTYAITDHVRPKEIAAGTDTEIGGTVTCSENLTKVQVMVLDQITGEVFVSAEAAPNAKTFDLATLNDQLAFNTLAEGTYKYRVWVHSANGSKSWPYLLTVTAPVATFSIAGRTYPTTLTHGDDFTVKGTVTCSEPMTKVQVMVLTLDSGEAVLEAVAAPNDVTFDISALDSQLAFRTLPVGSYKYRIWAHSAGGSKSWPFAFKVVESAFTLSDDTAIPTTLDIGTDFDVKGTVNGPEPLTEVAVSVVAQTGKVMSAVTAAPNAESFDLSTLDSGLSFVSIPAGTYTYTLTAKTATDSRTWSYSFKIIKPDVIFNISGETVPESLSVGKSFSVKGTVTATALLSKVTLAVKDASGTDKLSASAAPNATTFSLAALDSKMTFGKLTAGEYTYVITAESGNSVFSWEYPFVVVSGSPVDFKLADAVYPTALKVGASFSVKGTVTASETLTYVGISAVNSNGQTVITSENTAPAAKTFSISKLDSGFRFGSLTQGHYTYVITAKAGGQTHKWEYAFTVGDVISPGDVNADNAVNAIDSLMLYRHVSGQESLTAEQLKAIGSSPVNMTTCLKLYNFISGNAATFP